MAANIDRLRQLSASFRTFHRTNRDRAATDSNEARGKLAEMFLFFRTGQDHGRIARDVTPPRYMAVIASNLAPHVARRMVVAERVDLAHPNTDARSSLREALNKIAHQDEPFANYRIDVDRHLIVLEGNELDNPDRRWVAEIDVELFCDYCDGVLAEPLP